jgi:hypothetical protein
MSIRKGALFIVMSMLMLFALVMFTGAAHTNGDQIGRYRMQVITRNNFTDIFIIDTTTGVVKYVGKDEGKPFEAIQGK